MLTSVRRKWCFVGQVACLEGDKKIRLNRRVEPKDRTLLLRLISLNWLSGFEKRECVYASHPLKSGAGRKSCGWPGEMRHEEKRLKSEFCIILGIFKYLKWFFRLRLVCFLLQLQVVCRSRCHIVSWITLNVCPRARWLIHYEKFWGVLRLPLNCYNWLFDD